MRPNRRRARDDYCDVGRLGKAGQAHPVNAAGGQGCRHCARRYTLDEFAAGGADARHGGDVNNFEILQDYNKGDLRRLAKGKISEIVGLDADKILRDLSRVLGNYESVKHNIEFRTPPTDTVLEVMLGAPDHRVRTDDLKAAVKSRIQDYVSGSKAIDFRDTKKGYRLYARMLAAAWDFDGDFVESEANLLRVLRNELGITRKEHQLVMAHPEVNRLHFVASEYEEALKFLTDEGVLLCTNADGDSFFLLSDETAESLLQLWGYEMRQPQFARLLERLSKPQLVGVLKSADLRTAGSNQELVARVIEGEIQPSRVLGGLGTADLVSLLGKLGIQKSGNKEERVLRVIDHFKSDADIVPVTLEPESVEMEPQPELLSDESVLDLLDDLGIARLADILEALGLPKSGSKASRIERLALSPYNTESILQTLGLGDLRDLSVKFGLKKSGNKPDLIEALLAHYADEPASESPLSVKALLDFYDEISRQDRKAYPAEANPESLSATRMGLDFELATRYIFKNLLRLDTKAQRSGQEEPDGVLTDDDGNSYYYECKTVLSPPYSLPIRHRLQIRNYISSVAKSRRAGQFAGYLIIAHSFVDDIDQKLTAIEPVLDAPIAVIEARDLLAFAQKWQAEHPIDTYPIGAALKPGRITAKDLQRAGRA